MQQNRPITTAAAPIPLWERQHLFLEPVYADDQLYDEPAPAAEGEEHDLERPAA